MMKRISLIGSFLVAVTILASSCGTMTVVGKSGKRYTVTGKMDHHQGVFQYPIEKVFKASKKAVDSLNIKVDSEACDSLSGTVSGKLADGKKLRISLDNTNGATTVRIYVGDFADRNKTMQILEAIVKELE